jgi:hypothetical protein
LGSDEDLVFKLGVLPTFPKLQELKERRDEAALQRGKDAFWLKMSHAPNVSRDEEGNFVIHDNIFEMVTARK